MIKEEVIFQRRNINKKIKEVSFIKKKGLKKEFHI
jgi:hypothetical protein